MLVKIYWSRYKNMNRIEFTKSLLDSYGVCQFELLGTGQEGIVFTDYSFVYKVLVPEIGIEDYYDFRVSNRSKILNQKVRFTMISDNMNHLYKVELIEFQGNIIEKYFYEPSVACNEITKQEGISILTELWQHKIIILDIKPENLIRVNDRIKIIDQVAVAYNDNLFLNLCARLFLYVQFYGKMPNDRFLKLRRSAINNFELPELEGLRNFANQVFLNIVYSESKEFSHQKDSISENCLNENYTYGDLPNFDALFFKKLKENLYLSAIHISEITNSSFIPERITVTYNKILPTSDSVSLLIKVCAQDVLTAEQNIKHIVRQLSSPNSFQEKVVLIDSKQDSFLREYNHDANYDAIVSIVKRLKSECVIDRYILFDNKNNQEINKRWFNIESTQSHTTRNVPLTSQLYAFEQCTGSYILQMDCDVLIGRIDYFHSFLEDMLTQLRDNKNVVSVGFNIYNRESKAYFGFEDGGFVPEVRLGLISKERLQSLQPLPNRLDKNGKMNLSWYRSVEQKQKESKYCSIRGGNKQSFYIHPQNYRKTEPNSWMTILDRVEQNKIPGFQYGHWDVEGSLNDWCTPKRNEPMVILSTFRNITIPQFLRMWYSLMSQTYKDFGIILVDDNSDNGVQSIIKQLIEPYSDRVTFIRNRFKTEKIANEYFCIHNFVDNPESIIVMLDPDDALIGNKALQKVYSKYITYNADVVIGRVHQTYRISPNYRYPANFMNPREKGGNVWQHLKTFKRYLFESIPLTYFKHPSKDVSLSKQKWIERCDDYAIMVPIVEMSSNPVLMDSIIYFYDRDYEDRDKGRNLKEKCITSILIKPALSPQNVHRGRKRFSPNYNKIEIDITYRCNLSCLGCNRSCSQAPSNDIIDLDVIEHFIQESITLKKEWELINILGGEPTLHPQFVKIVSILQDKYVDIYSPNTVIQIVSNGYTQRSRDLCKEVECFKNVRIDYSSFKTGSKGSEYFSPFNDAPIDDKKFENNEFSNGCWVTSYCGIGLNNKGYYACAVCGGIDRVIGENRAIKALAEISGKKLEEQLSHFCQYCGNFKDYNSNFGNFILRSEKAPYRNTISTTWESLYERYNSARKSTMK